MILPFATMCMELAGSMLNEISQMERDKYCMVSLRCGIWGKRGKLIETEKKSVGNAREQWVNPTGGLLASVESPHPFRSCYSGTYLNKRKDVTHPEIRRRGGHTLHSHQR